jgi:CRP-like cAMP-binding protein
LTQDVLQQVSRRLQRAHQLRSLDSESADKKIAGALLWLEEKHGTTLNISRREISEIAGVAPETAIRVVLQFKGKRWLDATARTITIRQPEALQNFIEET